MKLFERLIAALVIFAACVSAVAVALPPLIPSLIVLSVLIAGLRLVWFHTSRW